MVNRGVRRSRILPLFTMVVALAAVVAPAGAGSGPLDPNFARQGFVTTDFADQLGDQARDVFLAKGGGIYAVGSARPEFAGTNNDSGDDMAVARFRANGSLDRTFSSDGRVSLAFGEGQRRELASAGALLPNGKLLLAGIGAPPGEAGYGAVVRLRRNGTLDTSFSDDGVAGLPMEVTDLELQRDGRIVVAGSAVPRFQDEDIALARLEPEGDLDPSFSGDGLQLTDADSAGDSASGVALQRDGKIVIAGVSNFGEPILARYGRRGNLDEGFAGDGIAELPRDELGGFSDVAVAADGGLIAAGALQIGSEGEDFLLAAYRPDGMLDEEFADQGIALTDFRGNTDVATDVLITARGKIVASGYAGAQRGSAADEFAVARYRPGGALDDSFSRDGRQSIDLRRGADNAYAAVIDRRARLILAGESNGDLAVARYGRGGFGR